MTTANAKNANDANLDAMNQPGIFFS